MRFVQLLAVFAVLSLLGCALRAASGGFTAVLSESQIEAFGLADLSVEEQSALNAMISVEVALARQGEISGFAGSFSSRRSPEERIAAGLDRLSTDQIAALDAFVAAVIAAGPIVPANTRRLSSRDVSSGDRFETHGEFSFMYGWQSGGGTMRGASFYSETYDRVTGLSVGIGISQFKGDGFRFYDDRHIGGGYGSYFGRRGGFSCGGGVRSR